MTDELSVARRTVLAVGVVGAGTVALAACGSSSPSSGGNSSSPKPNSSPESPGHAGSARVPIGGNGSSDTDTGTPLARVDDIKVGEAVAVTLADGRPAIVARPTADTVAAFSAKCTHLGCTVQPAGNQLHCPCHGSVYNAVTGRVIQGPAPLPLPEIAVHIADGAVVAS